MAYNRREHVVSFSDLDLSRLEALDDIWTDSLWDIPTRSKDGGHKLDYHGNFVPQIATQTFQRFTKAGDIVLDLFLGSGTSAIEALNLGRRCIGVEIKPDLVEYVESKLPPEAVGKEVALIQGDSTSSATKRKVAEALKGMNAAAAQLLVLHPPYHDIIRFSDMAEDLSNAVGVQEFLKLFNKVAQNGYDLLDPRRFAILVIGDKYTGGELVPLGFLCMQQMNEVGFSTKSIIVKNIEGNERGKGKTNNLWRYRALKSGFYIFKHEYVIVFRKPGK
jgi:16S rRNA G966 N2-methylase RsmD